MKKSAIVIMLSLAACSAQGGSEKEGASTDATKVKNPFGGVMQDRSSQSADEALYVEKCSMCHRQMGMGTVILARRMPPEVAMLEARKDLTADMVKTVVRQGLGNMPRINRGEVSDEQLDKIAKYIGKGQ